ncbi:hypothetical protein BDR07DRAFT_1489883 [Suillus spraguei]|nr:hypothetical protein BDR07DRAFT_1489883 [Suillus spraguei]
MAVMFLAYALSMNPDLGIHVTHPYGMEDDIDGWRVTDATNVYSQCTWQLRLEDVEKLSDCIIESWDDWVEGSPALWKEDGWLVEHQPVSVCCRFGQNQAIASSNSQTRCVEGANWQAQRLYAQIHYMSLAIATDIIATKVNRWEDIANEQILLNHKAVYDSPDPLVRQEVDLEELPHQDPETEDENKVYDKGGRRIPRCMGMVAPGMKSCGILVNLETVPELFSSFITDDEDMDMDLDVYEDQDIRTPLVNVYPQAFLRKTGHIQCNTVLPQFSPFLTKIHKSVTRPLRGIDDNLDEEDEELFNHDDGVVPPAVLSMACQFYNELSHQTHPSAALHEVQEGRITSALSGAYGTGRRAALNHPNIIRECEASLPHQRFDNKIKHDDVPHALRLENVYIIQLDSLLPGHCTGKHIYRDIIIPLARAWSHPDIFDVLRLHLVIFTPEWTPFGITSLLERIWKHQHPWLKHNLKQMPEIIELCSVLERTLAYAHMGNAKVIATSLMRPFWLVQSLLQQGLPTLSTKIQISSSSLTTPITRSQILTYGQNHFEAYKAEFHIMLSINQLAPQLFQPYTSELRHASAIALVALQAYVADVKGLVAAAVNKECANEEGDIGVGNVSNSKTHLTSLHKWLSCSYPLSYQDRAFEHLLRCIIPNHEDHSDGLPNQSEQQLTIRDFSLRIISMMRADNPSVVGAPLIYSAPSTTVFCIAGIYMLKYAPQHSPQAADSFMQDAFCGAANHLHINHVPWHVANVGLVGITLVSLCIRLGPTNSAAEASNKAQATDARAAWAVNSITLRSLPQFISRDSLPEEFSLDNIDVERGETEPLICQIYEWVFAIFNPWKPIHKIALLAGIYISRILPDIFTNGEYSPAVGDGGRAITQALRALPWNPNRSTRRGSRSTNQFIVMVPAYIIAVYEADSPLQKYFADHQGKGFPLRWNSKNSNKGIGSLLMIRLGLANAQKKLNAKYHEINMHLSDLQYGPFKIAVTFFGLNKAIELGRTSQMYTIKPAMQSIATHKHLKEAAKEKEDEEDDDEIEIIEHVKGKRARL